MYEDWVEKCLSCTHCYRKKDDDETLYCRCRNGKCNYKKYVRKEKRPLTSHKFSEVQEDV